MEVDVCQPPYFALIKAALDALGTEKEQNEKMTG
jgi:hypothetical protein